jgi:hypothetical protein
MFFLSVVSLNEILRALGLKGWENEQGGIFAGLLHLILDCSINFYANQC